jgi:hypothetical protein
MAHNNTVLGQMLQLLPRHVFEYQVERHFGQGPKPRELSYWSQLVAMLFTQLSGKKSLRDLVFSLSRHSRKLYHLGGAAVKRSSLTDANALRPARVFSETYFKLLQRFRAELARQHRPQRVKILDATYVPVCESAFPWAKFMPGQSAVKLHFLLDAAASAPQELKVTSGQVHELEVPGLYRQRWQIEIFFRWIKQNLKIKSFYGTSENAVFIQIWTAMIAYLLLLWLKVRSRTTWSILELTRLLQTSIMERTNLWASLCPRSPDPPDCAQLTLFNLAGVH